MFTVRDLNDLDGLEGSSYRANYHSNERSNEHNTSPATHGALSAANKYERQTPATDVPETHSRPETRGCLPSAPLIVHRPSPLSHRAVSHIQILELHRRGYCLAT